jgi:hypothetical protein
LYLALCDTRLIYPYKLGICNEPAVAIPGGDLAKTSRSLCMLSKWGYLLNL